MYLQIYEIYLHLVFEKVSNAPVNNKEKATTEKNKRIKSGKKIGSLQDQPT